MQIAASPFACPTLPRPCSFSRAAKVTQSPILELCFVVAKNCKIESRNAAGQGVSTEALPFFYCHATILRQAVRRVAQRPEVGVVSLSEGCSQNIITCM